MLLKLFTLFFIFLISPIITLAYNPIINDVSVPYEVKTIADINIKTEYLGDLKGDPHMYEFAVGEKTKLKMVLMQENSDTIIPFSLILVKQNEDRGGVSEMGRLNGKNDDWQVVEDKILGLDFYQSTIFETELSTGIYRVEVSTPENFGKYALVMGEKVEKQGYFSKLIDIYAFQTFFGGSIFSTFKSTYVYYPFGTILILIAFYFTWKKRNRIKGVENA